MRKTKGFTLIELLVVIAIIALLISILFPSLAKARELGKRAVCGTNLKNLANALAMYTTENKEQYPFMPASLASWGTAATGTSRATNPFLSSSANLSRSVTALMFLLVHGGQGPGLFVCPSSDKTVDDEIKDAQGNLYWDFKDNTKVSYSWQLPMQVSGSTTASNGVSSSSAPDLAIMADETPHMANSTIVDWASTSLTPEQKAAGLSQNHSAGEAIQVLYFGGHVQMQRAGNVGIDKDSIYTVFGTSSAARQKGVVPTVAGHNSKDDSALWGPK